MGGNARTARGVMAGLIAKDKLYEERDRLMEAGGLGGDWGVPLLHASLASLACLRLHCLLHILHASLCIVACLSCVPSLAISLRSPSMADGGDLEVDP
eukprot:4519411-Pyramimonas_sp.AAC.1